MNNFYIGYMVADNELKEVYDRKKQVRYDPVIEKRRRAWIKRALKSFDNDPPDTSFQQGYRQLLIEEIETLHLLNR